MPSKLDVVRGLIAELERDMAKADEEYRAALSAQVEDPTSTTARTRARALAARTSAVRGELAFMRDSVAGLEREARSEEAQARKREAAAALHETERLTPQLLEAGAGIDAAMRDLQKAVRVWIEAVDEVEPVARKFFKLAMHDHPQRAWIEASVIVTSTLRGVLKNAVASQVEEALRPLDMRQHAIFNFIKRKATEQESVERDVKKSTEHAAKLMQAAATEAALPL